MNCTFSVIIVENQRGDLIKVIVGCTDIVSLAAKNIWHMCDNYEASKEVYLKSTS